MPFPPPVGERVVAQIVSLDSEGLSQRKIARRLGVCKSTVQRVLCGDHKVPTRPSVAAPGPNEEPVGCLVRGERLLEKPQRCKCGHRIHVVPCRICKAKRLSLANPFPAVVDCYKCGRQPARLNATQVRCGKCGEFIRRRDQ